MADMCHTWLLSNVIFMSGEQSTTKVEPIRGVIVQPIGEAPEEQATLLGEVVSVQPETVSVPNSYDGYWLWSFVCLLLFSLVIMVRYIHPGGFVEKHARLATDQNRTGIPPDLRWRVWVHALISGVESVGNVTTGALSTIRALERDMLA